MRIGLTHSNLDKGEESVMSVSHPNPPNCEKHFTIEEMKDIFTPT